jgi:hypothetical protein
MSTTSTLLIAERVATMALIEDLRVVSARSCRRVARLRLAANDDLTVIVRARSNTVDWDRGRGAGHQHAPMALYASVRSSAERLS